METPLRKGGEARPWPTGPVVAALQNPMSPLNIPQPHGCIFFRTSGASNCSHNKYGDRMVGQIVRLNFFVMDLQLSPFKSNSVMILEIFSFECYFPRDLLSYFEIQMLIRQRRST